MADVGLTKVINNAVPALCSIAIQLIDAATSQRVKWGNKGKIGLPA